LKLNVVKEKVQMYSYTELESCVISADGAELFCTKTSGKKTLQIGTPEVGYHKPVLELHRDTKSPI
jgi:hypothetical protein